MNKLICFAVFVFCYISNSYGQMPPPGYERAKKMQEERNKLSRMERDSVTLTDTIMIFDPDTYESETKIIQSRVSLKEYCIKVLGIGNPDMLLDGNPHTIIDPKTYEDLTIRLNAAGKIDTIPK